MGRSLYVLDTDIGVDDSLAVYIFAKHSFPSSALVTSFGNVPENEVYLNAKLCAEVFGFNGRLYRGASKPLKGKAPDAKYVHGNDGLGGARLAFQDDSEVTQSSTTSFGSWETFEAYCLEHDEINWLSIGPATNLARAIRNPNLLRRIKATVMAGVFFDKGNITEYAEFNAHCDPVALDAVFESRISLTVVPLDVCRKVQFRLAELNASFENLSRLQNSILSRAHAQYCENYRSWEGFLGCFPHDSVALIAMLFPEHMFFVQGACSCSSSYDDFGRTVINLDLNGPHRVCLGGNLKFARRYIESLGTVRA
jgi:inosine-uridine nucleoside N-ribohydrolase